MDAKIDKAINKVKGLLSGGGQSSTSYPVQYQPSGYSQGPQPGWPPAGPPLQQPGWPPVYPSASPSGGYPPYHGAPLPQQAPYGAPQHPPYPYEQQAPHGQAVPHGQQQMSYPQPQHSHTAVNPYPSPAPPQPAPASNVRGHRKRALLCGCNYKGTSAALGGCINDVKCMAHLLKMRFGYKAEDIRILTDDQYHNPAAMPTRANMYAHFQWLLAGCSPGDTLVFHFSGHGSQTTDWSGDEADGQNETILPCDFKHAGQIVDDELNRYLVNPLPHGVRLTAVIDACHSGSAMDLPYRAKMKNGQPVWKSEYRRRTSAYKGTAGGLAIQIGASRDSQTAADTSQLSGNVSTGAATYSLIEAVERLGTGISYAALLHSMTVSLEKLRGPSSGGGMPPMALGGLLGSLADGLLGQAIGGGAAGQTPMLSSNVAFDLNQQIVL